MSQAGKQFKCHERENITYDEWLRKLKQTNKPIRVVIIGKEREHTFHINGYPENTDECEIYYWLDMNENDSRSRPVL